jgi:CheY-like chemotaxis protein
LVKILIVDDEPDFVRLLRIFLEKNGYEVHGANDGEECLSKINDVKPNLVLMDVMMPGLSGWEVCKSLKEDPLTRDIPVAMLTVRGTKEDVKRSFEYARADEHLSKPIPMKEMLFSIKKMATSE